MAKEEKKVKSNKNVKKDNKHFAKDFKSEIKKVIWPTPKQLVNNTIAVIVIVLITAAIVFVLDLAFGAVNTYGIDKLKDKVKSNNQEVVQENVIETDVINSEELQSDVESESTSEETPVIE